jgi:DNA repair protein RecN (Recombination protein N)
MLLELSIKNFAIIDRLALSFGPGLNIFTGETGAGKSIILDAVALVLGDRATSEIIRTSADEAEVEALFDVSGCKGLKKVIEDAGIDFSDTLVVKRVVQRTGRNKIYINGSLATLVTLTEIGRRLIDIYGQSEHQSLTRPEEHVEVLDSFAGLTAPENGLRASMSGAYRDYIALKKECEVIVKDPAELDRRRDLLGYQLKEIEEAALTEGEEEELATARKRLENAERIKEAVLNAERAVYSDAGSVVERLGSVLKPLKEASGFDEALASTVEALQASLFEIEDAAGFLRDYSGSIEYDPEELERVGDRLDLISKLKKKYDADVAGILAKSKVLEEELSTLDALEGRVEGLEAKMNEARELCLLTAGKLTGKRLKESGPLKEQVESELKDLGMSSSVFEVVIEAEKSAEGTVRFGPKGADRVSFFISPNPGEEVKPLARIASGGELSRIMLAIKRVTAAGRVPTLVFDEIDAGVGGPTAQVVGLKLNEVAGSHQVLCITHLPQIAAFASDHYVVTKGSTKEGRTVTSVKKIDGGELVEQISWMLGGSKITEASRKHAVELVEAAKSLGGG